MSYVHKIVRCAAAFAAMAVTLIALAAPAVAGQSTSSDDQDDHSVTLEDMLVDSERSEAGEADDSTFQARDSDLRYPSHWSWIIAGNALAGGLAGGLIGAGIILVRGATWDWTFIGQFTGGGLLLGATIGIFELLLRTRNGESNLEYLPDAVDPPASIEWMEQEMPASYELPVIHLEF